VALTRAQQCFFASGIASERGRAKTSYWERIGAALAALGCSDGIHGEVPARAEMLASTPAAETVATPQPPACPATGRRREAASRGMAYGTQLHAALDWLSSGGDAGQPPVGIPLAEWPAFRAAARAILDAPQLRAFFEPSGYLRALNEAEFALPDGRVGRIDRLVETADGFWLLDYKSGRPEGALLDDYRTQMEAYRAAVGALFPGRPVRCGLVFGDAAFMEI
jgi:ATP-dependent helicase/nuclease subunit A